MSVVYQHDNNGYYAGRCDDFSGPLPHNCVRAAPPALPWRRVWPRWNGAAWESTEDHRARRVTGRFSARAGPGTHRLLAARPFAGRRRLGEPGPDHEGNRVPCPRAR